MSNNISKLIHLAFVDGQNLYQSLKQHNLELDLVNFTDFVKQKYKPDVLFWFVKYTQNDFMLNIYKELEEMGWTIQYSSSNKDIYDSQNNLIGSKTNIDADLIVKAMQEYYEEGEYRLVLVSGDGDFVPLLRFFEQKTGKVILLSASPDTTSGMLRYDRINKKNREIIYVANVADMTQ